jgi:hypothetical protein
MKWGIAVAFYGVNAYNLKKWGRLPTSGSGKLPKQFFVCITNE